MSTIARTLLIFCLFALSFNLPAADQAPVTSFLNKTAHSITGYDVGLKISFSSQLVDDGKTVLVDVQLGGKRITNRVDITDPKNKTIELKAVNVINGKLTSLNAKELRALSQLERVIGAGNTPVHDVLMSTIALVLSTDSDGEVIDFSSQKIKEELEKTKDKTLLKTITATSGYLVMP